ncbi:MAG: glycosyltransferase family 4 protein [Pelatocladus maniniholoensis HA4357-MV3]|jgi:starch synthase|uniref:Glycosyltransferase family 4 protein n=1 Tax=Pelatocladus maniniholoensis HA4357-MV3 TaxID=1117104 RepID=A0A9E3LT37_9NOST|nr:glycosyltransferase family 4 protein [Pelatocladus maniniholoensis HA4357-MV3]
MVNPRISLIHPTSNPFSRNAALALAEVDILDEIITTTAYNPHGTVAHYLNLLPTNISNRLSQEAGRRTWITPAGVQMRTHPWRELIRIALIKTGMSKRLGLKQQQLVDWVYAALDNHVAKHHLQDLAAVYAYEDGAANTFQVAKQQGILCLYDLPIPFYRKNQDIQIEEANNFPDLAPVLQAIQEPTWKVERKEQEIQLADHIFVASSFTKKSLLDVGVQPEKISVIPYGSPIEYFQLQPKTDKIFRALFAGRVGPRKGVHYLLKAWQELQLSDAELLLVGINEFPEKWLSQYRDIFRYMPSVPHASLNQYYSNANVLVFPSLLEGFGLVLLEAMACGIPVITTANTAALDIITDGVEGFIVPIRDVEALKEKLEWCYCHPQELVEMGQAARRKAEQLTWGKYRQKLGNRVQEILASC